MENIKERKKIIVVSKSPVKGTMNEQELRYNKSILEEINLKKKLKLEQAGIL